MLRGETIAFHIYSLANISRGDKYPATIQLYSQYIPFITIKLVNPALCFHHQDFWRLKNNFRWLNMCLLAITQKNTGLVEGNIAGNRFPSNIRVSCNFSLKPTPVEKSETDSLVEFSPGLWFQGGGRTFFLVVACRDPLWFLTRALPPLDL